MKSPKLTQSQEKIVLEAIREQRQSTKWRSAIRFTNAGDGLEKEVLLDNAGSAFESAMR